MHSHSFPNAYSNAPKVVFDVLKQCWSGFLEYHTYTMKVHSMSLILGICTFWVVYNQSLQPSSLGVSQQLFFMGWDC
jgi:hypothetical protein